MEQCCQLPLGREAALFVVGAVADYRAQVRLLFVYLCVYVCVSVSDEHACSDAAGRIACACILGTCAVSLCAALPAGGGRAASLLGALPLGVNAPRHCVRCGSCTLPACRHALPPGMLHYAERLAS